MKLGETYLGKIGQSGSHDCVLSDGIGCFERYGAVWKARPRGLETSSLWATTTGIEESEMLGEREGEVGFSGLG